VSAPAACPVSRDTRCHATHRSYTADRRWDECQWRAHAVEDLGVREYMPPAAIVGMAVDQAVCDALSGQPVNIERLIAEAIEESGDPKAAWPLEEMADKATGLYSLWEERVRPTWPAIYATQLELHWPTASGTTYHAHLDVVFEDGSFTDLKTSERRLEPNRAAVDLQLTYYAWGLWAVFGHLAPSVGLDALVWGNPPRDVLEQDRSARKPWCDRQRSVRTVEQLEALARIAEQRERARSWANEAQLWLPTGRFSPYACRGCPAQSLCPAWTGYDHEEVAYVGTE
jgi:hypothetical protein